MEHTSVLLKETIDLLDVKPNGIYIDGTLGRGGHALELVKRLEGGHLYAFDKDLTAIEESQTTLKGYLDKVTFIHDDFKQMDEQMQNYNVDQVDGVMLDLGVSSPQFDDPNRGFSYRYDAPLDMRMDQSQSRSAYDVVNASSEETLIHILQDYGEERFAKGIARAIVKQRSIQPIATTNELVSVIKSALPEKVLNKKGHPAKQTFQALRIEVNEELTSLRAGLEKACDLLAVHGRCAVITFHSLEDRMVKQTFKALSTAPFVNPKLPLKESQMEQSSFSLLNRKVILPKEEELDRNHRAHSAKLRGIERIR